jgi:hypothetical protein
MAAEIFADMQTGGVTPCKRGIFMRKDRVCVQSTANELYLAVAASLANRMPSNKSYEEIAMKQWKWFQQSGIINPQNRISDGLDRAWQEQRFADLDR